MLINKVIMLSGNFPSMKRDLAQVSMGVSNFVVTCLSPINALNGLSLLLHGVRNMRCFCHKEGMSSEYVLEITARIK